MKTFIKIILAIFVLSIVIGLMFGNDTPISTDTANAESNEETTQVVPDDIEVAKDKLAEEIKNDKIALKKVQTSFTYQPDEFNGSGWYSHKLWGRNMLNRNGLVAHVNKEGYIYLSSNYHAEDWLFHEKIQVKIDDRVIDSEVVPTYDSNHITENSGGSVWEIINFTENRDNGILDAIAENPKADIKVRFVGRQYRKDFTLSKGDKLAIEECKRLADLLSRINSNESFLKANP
jgi:hypothetical protein